MITLKISGYSVEFKPHYTQRAEEAYNKELTDGIIFKESITGQIVSEGIRPDAVDRANKAVLRVMIQKIVKGAEEVQFSDDFILDLPRPDYLQLVNHIGVLQGKDKQEQEEGKKNDRKSGGGAVTAGGGKGAS